MSEDDVQRLHAMYRVETPEAMRQATGHVTPAKRALSGVELKRLADTGGFAVDETTGDRMIKALEDLIDAVNARWSALEKLGADPPLSTTSTARWVARHTVRTASDDRGLLTQLRRAREELPQYVEAIRSAKRKYSDTESSTRARLDGFERP